MNGLVIEGPLYILETIRLRGNTLIGIPKGTSELTIVVASMTVVSETEQILVIFIWPPESVFLFLD